MTSVKGSSHCDMVDGSVDAVAAKRELEFDCNAVFLERLSRRPVWEGVIDPPQLSR
jgi:hypothetical protein